MRQHQQMGLKKTYKSTPEDIKRKLMYKVLVETRSIKQAAKLLRINYSTAKTIVRQRKSLMADSTSTTHSNNRPGRSHISLVRPIKRNEASRIHIVSSIGEEHIGGLRAGFKQISHGDVGSSPLVVVGKFKISLA